MQTKMVVKKNNAVEDKVVLPTQVAEYVATGTEKILDSPHVSEGPGRIANAPVPSVYHDDRGSIHRLKVGEKRINLSYSKKDVMRSGYLHNLKKEVFVISGEVEVWILTHQNTKKTTYSALEYFEIRPWVPHVFFFKTSDAVVSEWWDTSKHEEFQCWFYHPYRRLVDIHNAQVPQTTGRHQLLVPQDESDTFHLNDSGFPIGKFLLCTACVGLGFVAGSLFAGRRLK